MEGAYYVKDFFLALGLIVLSSVLILLEKIWFKPLRLRSMLEKQGINGPKPSFPFGNIFEMQQIHPQPPPSVNSNAEWVYSLLPYFHTWKKRYGTKFLYSTGIQQHLYIEDPELIKELNLNRSLDLGRPLYLTKSLEPMIGHGILAVNGQEWSFQRNLISPEFFISKVKNMMDRMEDSSLEMIKTWENHITKSKDGIADILIDTDVKVLAEDIISKACFGSDYEQGKEIFAKLEALIKSSSAHNIIFGFLNLSFLASKETKEMWRLKEEVDTLILKIIHNREIQNKNKNVNEEKQGDLLQTLLECSETNNVHNMKQIIIDICKNIYFAGSDTTAVNISWTLLLLALHPEWQQRVRSEIFETFGNTISSVHDMSKLQKLKTLTMVIQESLRLYGSGVTTQREVLADMKVGDIVLPKGINLWFFFQSLHRDIDNWGPDADEFKPERFANGVSGACKYPQAYVPFGIGTRICLGQNFALNEMKIVLSLLLHKFSFSVSPEYRHCPIYEMLLKPKYGVRLLVSKAKI